MNTVKIIWALIFVLTHACPILAAVPEPLKNLSNITSEIKKKQDEKESKNQEKLLRVDAIRQAGMTMAIQTAVQYRYDQLNKKMESIAKDLDKLDFSLLLIHSGKVLPPIFREAKKALHIKDTTHSISSAHTFEILQAAKIVANTPTWRQYLVKNFNAVEEIHDLLLPKNEEEQEIWKKAVKQGWEIGIKQADSEFSANLNRLIRDFLGLITYHRLALQGVVSVPIVAEGKYGIRVNGNTLNIDQREFRITTPTKFNKAEIWTPIIHLNKNPQGSGT